MAAKKSTPKKTVKKSKPSPAVKRDARRTSLDMYRLKLVLSENPLLATFTPREIETFCRRLSLRQVRKGEKIFKEGDHGDYLFFVIQGKVEVRLEGSHEHHLLGLYAEGALVGEMAVVDEYPRSATVTALEDSEILILTKSRFDEIITKNKDLGIKLLLSIARVISTRLRNTLGRFFELA